MGLGLFSKGTKNKDNPLSVFLAAKYYTFCLLIMWQSVKTRQILGLLSHYFGCTFMRTCSEYPRHIGLETKWQK